MPSKFEPGGIV